MECPLVILYSEVIMSKPVFDQNRWRDCAGSAGRPQWFLHRWYRWRQARGWLFWFHLCVFLLYSLQREDYRVFWGVTILCLMTYNTHDVGLIAMLIYGVAHRFTIDGKAFIFFVIGCVPALQCSIKVCWMNEISYWAIALCYYSLCGFFDTLLYIPEMTSSLLYIWFLRISSDPQRSLITAEDVRILPTNHQEAFFGIALMSWMQGS